MKDIMLFRIWPRFCVPCQRATRSIHQTGTRCNVDRRCERGKKTAESLPEAHGGETSEGGIIDGWGERKRRQRELKLIKKLLHFKAHSRWKSWIFHRDWEKRHKSECCDVWADIHRTKKCDLWKKRVCDLVKPRMKVSVKRKCLTLLDSEWWKVNVRSPTRTSGDSWTMM